MLVTFTDVSQERRYVVTANASLYSQLLLDLIQFGREPRQVRWLTRWVSRRPYPTALSELGRRIS